MKDMKHGSVKDWHAGGRLRNISDDLGKQIVDGIVVSDDSDGEPVYRENARHVLDQNPTL